MVSDYGVSFWQIMKTVEVNHSRVLKHFQNPLEIFGLEDFQARHRFTKEGAIALFDIIENDSLLHSRAQAIGSPAMHQMLIAQRYYATGHFQTTDGDLMGVHQNNFTHIKMHSKEKAVFMCFTSDLPAVKRSFFEIAAFPAVVGGIDCTHIPIISLGGDDAEVYRNRKGYFP